MSNRADFDLSTKPALAARVNNRCSFPECPMTTLGPSDESDESTSNTGVACHIVSASQGPGARRTQPTMPESERCSIGNGIWMCQTHAKLIDTDEHRFSIDMLKKWRAIAEVRAQYQQANGKELTHQAAAFLAMGFPYETIELSNLRGENSRIGNALLDTCVPIIWGHDLADAVRDVLIEITRNAFTHGGATKCSISISHNAITHKENGNVFNCFELRTHERGRGGSSAVRNLISRFGEKLILGSSRGDIWGHDLNQTCFALATEDNLSFVEPCTVHVSKNDLNAMKDGAYPRKLYRSHLAPCHVVYLLLPDFAVPSDVAVLNDALSHDAVRAKQLVFVGKHVSALVETQLKEFFPDCRVINV